MKDGGSVAEHEDREDDEMQASQGFRQALVVACKPTEAVDPAEAAFDDPASRKQHEPFLGFGKFHHVQIDSFFLSRLRRLLAGIALIHECHRHGVTGDVLYLLRQRAHVSTLLFVGRRDLHCKQMPERIHCHMHLAAFLPLIAVVTGARAALTGGLQCPPVQDDGAGLALLPLGDTQDGTQVTDHGFKAARLQPALRLLVNRFPWREVVGEQAPRRSGTRHPAQRIEHRPQCVLALRSVLRHQAQVRRRKRPLFVGNVGRICAFALHPTTIAASPKSS
ncbi:hypothetical protein FD63_09845 [Xanthomonas translucens pv. undulosa]|nr:hypothetical protein FD63_09845 [Xanthomonas translucens pv. undulosa]